MLVVAGVFPALYCRVSTYPEFEGSGSRNRGARFIFQIPCGFRRGAVCYLNPKP